MMGFEHTTTASWQPDLATPKVVAYGMDELGAPGISGETLSRWLVENSVRISFPATDPSTLVDDAEREDRLFEMRYTGPNIFASPKAPNEVMMLHAIYLGAMLKVWNGEFGLQVTPLGLNERAFEAFTTNPDQGESSDPHIDTYVTCAGYLTPGAALVVSHCRNARNRADIEDQPSTLVLPRPGSLVFFEGTDHPHVGVSPGITEADQPAIRMAKLQALRDRFKIVNLVQNFYIPDRFGPGDPDNRGPAAIPKLLTQSADFGGDKSVLSLNYHGTPGKKSSLDAVFGDLLGPHCIEGAEDLL